MRIIFQETDEDLMARMALDESGAFEELIRRYETRLIAHAYYQVRSHEVAEDLVQVTFTAVWVQRVKFDKNLAKFSHWVYRILQNQIDKYLRDNKYTRAMTSLSILEEDKILVVPEAPGWFDNYTESQINQLKQVVLRVLTEEERQLYHLKDELGLSYEAIRQQSGFSGLPIATLKKRRQRYKDKIIKALAFEKLAKGTKGRKE